MWCCTYRLSDQNPEDTSYILTYSTHSSCVQRNSHKCYISQLHGMYVVGSKFFGPDIQKPRQMEITAKEYIVLFKGHKVTSSQMWKVCWNKGRLYWKTYSCFTLKSWSRRKILNLPRTTHTRARSIQMLYIPIFVTYDPHKFYVSKVKCSLPYVSYTGPNILLSPQTEGPSRLGPCLADNVKLPHQRKATRITIILVSIF
jgi:hypothetical protein